MPNKIKYNTEERDNLRRMAQIYGTNPFSGKCYTEEIKVHKMGGYYNILVPEKVAEKYLIPEEFLYEDTHTLLMIKPVDGDDNYIFFRRL